MTPALIATSPPARASARAKHAGAGLCRQGQASTSTHQVWMGAEREKSGTQRGAPRRHAPGGGPGSEFGFWRAGSSSPAKLIGGPSQARVAAPTMMLAGQVQVSAAAVPAWRSRRRRPGQPCKGKQNDDIMRDAMSKSQEESVAGKPGWEVVTYFTKKKERKWVRIRKALQFALSAFHPRPHERNAIPHASQDALGEFLDDPDAIREPLGWTPDRQLMFAVRCWPPVSLPSSLPSSAQRLRAQLDPSRPPRTPTASPPATPGSQRRSSGSASDNSRRSSPTCRRQGRTARATSRASRWIWKARGLRHKAAGRAAGPMNLRAARRRAGRG